MITIVKTLLKQSIVLHWYVKSTKYFECCIIMMQYLNYFIVLLIKCILLIHAKSTGNVNILYHSIMINMLIVIVYK